MTSYTFSQINNFNQDIQLNELIFNQNAIYNTTQLKDAINGNSTINTNNSCNSITITEPITLNFNNSLSNPTQTDALLNTLIGYTYIDINNDIKTTNITDIKPNGSSGGSFISGSWRTRTLNDITDNSPIQISNNQIIIPAGLYKIYAMVPAYRVTSHQAKLQNITDSITEIEGSSEYAPNSNNSSQSSSKIFGQINYTTTKTFEIQHQCKNSRNSDGFGSSASIGSGNEIYTQLEITKL